MAIELRKAKRIQAKVKIAIGGVSGSGKTMSSLLLAFGLVKAEHPEWTDAQVWEKIVIIDSENSSGSLYVGTQVGAYRIGEYFTIDVEPPFEEQTLIDALTLCENNNMECVIIDSASSYWTDALETQGKIAERTKNAFAAWRPVKNDIQKMMNKILQSRFHVISCYRAKTEYTQETDGNGKKVVKSLGMGIIAEGNSAYEYTTMFMLDNDHVANATKDRTGVFDGKFFTITPETGAKLYQWLAEGEVPIPQPVIQKVKAPAEDPTPAPSAPDDQLKKAISLVDTLVKQKIEQFGAKEPVVAVVELVLGNKNYLKCADIDKLRELYQKLNEMN